VASLETELGRVRAELGTVTAQRDSAINQVRESETRLEEAEDDADTAEAEVERLGAELSRAKEEHETAAKLGRESLQEALASAASAREGESRARQLLWQLEAQEDVAGGEDQEEQEEAQTSSAKIKADRADDDDDDDDDAGATRATPRLSPVLAVASQYEAEELRGRLAERDAQLQEARSDAEEAGQALGKLHAVLRAEAAARAVVEGRLEAAMAALQERAQSAEAAAPASSGVESTRGSARDSSVVAELRRERAEALMTVAGAREELARVSKELHRNQRMFEELRGASVERRVVGRLLVEWIARPDKRRDVAHLMAGMLALSPREQQLVRSAAGDDTMAVPTSADGVAATDVVAATDSFFGFARALSEFVAEAAADQPPGTKAEPAGGPPDATPTSSNGPKAEKLVLRFDSV
jgi:chemotaxis protein histidine kinase CheA